MTDKVSIEDYIPQRPPFVMVDRVLSDDDQVTRTSFQVREDNLFMEDGLLQAPALVENIAQTAAAGAGYKSIHQNMPVKVGFIGAIRNLVVFGLPAVGKTLVTETRVVNKVFDVSIVEGTLTCEGEILASCEMKIFLQP